MSKIAFYSDESGEPIMVGEHFYLMGNGDKISVEEFEELGEAHHEKYDDWCRYVATGEGTWVKAQFVTPAISSHIASVDIPDSGEWPDHVVAHIYGNDDPTNLPQSIRDAIARHRKG